MLGSILGGVASGLLGGIFGQKASDSASKRQANAMADQPLCRWPKTGASLIKCWN
jgi:hypothetical protein